MAHLHVPKPLHGWREFAGEVGIIVLGVLIALGAEEATRSIVGHHEARELRQSMLGELRSDRSRWEANHHDVACTLNQLEQIRAWAAHPGSDSLEFDPPVFWTMHDSAWQIGRSSPTMAVLPLEERDRLAQTYFVIEAQERILENLAQALVRISALAKNANQPSNRDSLPEAASEAEGILKLMNTTFPLLEEDFDELGVRSNIAALGPTAFNFQRGCPGLVPATHSRNP